jgi:putative ABC transport system ATP-binding protein
MSYILKTENLCKVFGDKKIKYDVLRDMNLQIKEGEFVVIMGSSGSGKSTLLYMLSGMDTPTSGSIYFSENVISTYSNNQLAKFRKENCGFVFQGSNLNSTLSVMDNVLVAGYLSNSSRNEVRERAKELLEKMGLGENYYDKFSNQLSGGEAQRVAIVRGVINSPKILFADEPTGALNSQNTLEVLNLFSNLNGEGQTIVTVTHDIKTALRGSVIHYISDGAIKGTLKLGKFSDKELDKRQKKLQSFLNEMGW